MDAQFYRKAMSVIDRVMDSPPEQIRAQIAAECGNDADLRFAVEELLGNDYEDFLERSPIEAAALRETSGEKADPNIGRRFGVYELIEKIGAGGMGAVYKATRADGEFSRQVAIKIIRRGMDSDAILRRFFNERQILAELTHPNVARLIDGGTTEDGMPYFVMEYVAGLPIIEYADKHQLTLIERLDLFRKVCAAVSYAHRNLVVHRDLKPSNILVTKDGEPKLLDFGIAKLLKTETATGETATQTFVLTPEYASPEQVRGERLSTATDVYSLGVILYELLTGERPYKIAANTIPQIIKAVCETEPIRPSSFVLCKNKIQLRKANNGQRTKQLKGDLDNIVLKSLRKEPENRYSSIEQFSEDLRRHLRGLPVSARPATILYRTQKFIRRNPLAFAAILALLAGIVATSSLAVVARRERVRAERRFNDVRHLANSLMFDINDEIQHSPVKARELLAKRAIEYLDGLATESQSDAVLRRELAIAYRKIGDVQSELYAANVGDSGGALESYGKSLAMLENLFAADQNNLEIAHEFATSLLKMGEISGKTGNVAVSVNYQRQAVDLREKLASREPQNEDLQKQLANCYARFGHILRKTGNLPAVLENYGKARQIYEKLIAENPTNHKNIGSLSVVYNYTGFILGEMGDVEGSLENYRLALAMTEAIYNRGEIDERNKRNISDMTFSVAIALRETGNVKDSLAYLKKSLLIARSLWEGDPNNSDHRNAVADCLLEIGKSLAAARKFAAADAAFLESLRHYETIWQQDPKNLYARRQIFHTKQERADALLAKGETGEALAIYRETLAVFQNLVAVDSSNSDWQHDLALNYRKLGEAQLLTGEKSAAAQNFAQAAAILEHLVADSPTNARRRRDLARTREFLGNVSALEKHLAKR